MDYLSIIRKYYTEGDGLYRILTTHSRQVADKSLLIADKHPELGIDKTFLEEAAMLHDIGIIRCNAPGIQCFGTEPYILHGRIGAEMLKKEGLLKHARVCERHTGAGISKGQIIERKLPLPHQDFLPETLEEQIICYADKFFSKSHLEDEKTMERAEESVAKHGEEGLARFRHWAGLFE